MKKFRKISYLVLIIIIAILLIVIYSTISAGNSKNSKSKALAEVEFLEMKLETMLNQMNNIEIRNYDVSVSEISKQKQQKQSGGTSQAESSEEGSGGSGGGSQQGSSSEQQGNDTKKQESNSSGNSQSSEKSKKFELEPIGILSTAQEVKWENIKNEIEILYSSIPTITLDLYQLNVSQEEILGFNKEFDILTTTVKSENKEDTLSSLSRLYEFIPRFLQNATDDEVDKVIANTKNNIFKAYSKLDAKNWEEIGNDTKQATDNFSKLLSNTNIDSGKQYRISKVFVMINELQNAVEVEDESVFLIKYKNILEEINNI